MKRKKTTDKPRVGFTFERMLKDPDSVRGGTALWMMFEMINAHREKRSLHAGAIEYWGTMFWDWFIDPDEKTLEKLLELDGTQGRSPVATAFKFDFRNLIYLENMGLLVGAGFTVEEAAKVVAEGNTATFKLLNQGRLMSIRSVTDLFQADGGIEKARAIGFFSDDPETKAKRDELVKQIPIKYLPTRFR